MTTGYVPWSLFNAHDWSKFNAPRHAMTETRLLPAKTQRFIEFLRERLTDSEEQQR
jgi:hypothetical protein